MTCRCVMCGAKNAGSNKVRNSYVRANIQTDEDGIVLDAKNKKHSHKVRRIRETREWKAEVNA
jgi:hypothetical protein